MSAFDACAGIFEMFIYTIIVAAILAAIAMLADNYMFCNQIEEFLGKEPFKISLQFVLVTLLGGSVFALLAARRDKESKRVATIANLQDIDAKVKDAYRKMKAAKRRLRARRIRADQGSSTISKENFQSGMEDLLVAQLSVEEIQDSIQCKSDLLVGDDRDICDALTGYTARYLHDVYEEYERRKVPADRDLVIIDERCPRLDDFISPQNINDSIREILPRFANADSLERQIDLMRELIKVKPRSNLVAYACIRFVSAFLKSLIDTATSPPAPFEMRKIRAPWNSPRRPLRVISAEEEKYLR